MTRRSKIIAGFVLAAVAVVGALSWSRFSSASPEPPVVQATHLDPVIAQAIEEHRRKVLRSSHSAIAWGRLGMVLNVHDFTDQANLCFCEAERLDPRDPRWPYFQGIDLIKSQPLLAIAKLRQAVERSDGLTTPSVRLANVLIELGKFEDAETILRSAEKSASENVWVKLGLGRLYFERGQWNESLSMLDTPAIDPETRRAARNMRLSIFSQLKDEVAAKNEKLELLALPPDMPMQDKWAREMNGAMVGLNAQLGQINQLLATNRGSEAAQLLFKTVERYPKSEEAWRFAGQLLLKTSDLKNAETAWRRVVEYAPDSVEGHYNLGVTLHRKGQLNEASRNLERAIALKPDHGMAYFLLGKCFEQQRDYSNAIIAFRQASRCQPHAVETYVALAEALVRDKQPQLAMFAIEQALQLRPNDEGLLKLQQKAEQSTTFQQP